jgi:hypothetical protein
VRACIDQVKKVKNRSHRPVHAGGAAVRPRLTASPCVAGHERPDHTGEGAEAIFYQAPACEFSAAGNTILKFYQLTDSMAEYMQCANKSRSAEWSFAPAEEELAVMDNARSNGSAALILGRSGTGKTSILLRRMYDDYRMNALRRQKHGGTDFNQLFVTRNPVLVNTVQKSFELMQRTLSEAVPPGMTAAPHQPHRGS